MFHLGVFIKLFLITKLSSRKPILSFTFHIVISYKIAVIACNHITNPKWVHLRKQDMIRIAILGSDALICPERWVITI